MKPTETRIRVRYAETDQMGVVYHANYLVWMEVGRVELCRALGINYRDIEAKSGIFMTVAEASCRYVQPARFDDEICVEAAIARAHRRIMVFVYTIRRAVDGAVLATGETKHIFCGRDLQSCSLPREYFAQFGIEGHTRAGETTLAGN